MAHNFAALLAVLDGVDDPGFWKGKSVHDRIQKSFPVNVAFVRSTTQPIPPISSHTVENDAKSPVVTAYTIVLIVTTKLDT